MFLEFCPLTCPETPARSTVFLNVDVYSMQPFAAAAQLFFWIRQRHVRAVAFPLGAPLLHSSRFQNHKGMWQSRHSYKIIESLLKRRISLARMSSLAFKQQRRKLLARPVPTTCKIKCWHPPHQYHPFGQED